LSARGFGDWNFGTQPVVSYYGRFGFETDPALGIDGVPPEYFLRLAFSQVYGDGTVSYHPAFNG
jgi:putative acetyltransferase